MTFGWTDTETPEPESARSTALLALTTALMLCLCACSSEDDPAELFVGPVGSSNVVAATLFQGDEAIVYTCGLDASLDTSTAWTRVPVVNGSVEVAHGTGTLVATREATRVLGTLMVDGTPEALDLAQVSDVTEAGLFQNVEGTCRTAAISFRRGGQAVVQGARFCDGMAPFYQVTPVLPVEFLQDTLRVRYFDGTIDRELDLRRVTNF